MVAARGWTLHCGTGPRSGCRLCDRARGRRRRQLVPIVLLESLDEDMDAAFDGEGLAEPHAVDQRKDRLLQERPALAQKWIVGFDEDRLHRDIRPLRDQSEATLENIDRLAARARTLRENQQRDAGRDLGSALPDHADRCIVADIA